MKILLINPPRSNENKILEYASEEAKRFIHRKLIGPPLGLLTIAAAVSEYDVSFLEMKGEYDLDPDAPVPDELVTKYLRKYEPDVVGVTFIASEFNAGINIFKTVKRYNPNILTIAGGLHATLCPDDFTDKSVDVICPGQCAHIFREVVRVRENNGDLNTVNGIIINTDNGLVKTAPSIARWNAANEDFIRPDRSLLKRWVQTYKVGNNPNPATYLFTSLGCQHKCSFCSIWPQHNGKIFQREIESIINELKSVNEYDIVRFADANTVIDPRYIHALCDRIIEEGIGKDFVMDVRVDTVVENPDLIEKLAKCGLKVVICGFESFRQDELEKYQKRSSADNIAKAINILQENGIMIRGNYVVPNYYKEDDFKALADYASGHRVVYAGYTILTPMPGTEFFQEVKDQIVDFDLDKYNFFNCVLKTELPLKKFYENVANLWLIKKGNDII